MKAVRMLVHSLALARADLGGIAGGAVVASWALEVNNQIWLQLPAAVFLTALFFCGWVFASGLAGLLRLRLADGKELAGCFIGSIIWAPLVFVPLHYFTQGYLTSIGNLIALAAFQVPVNCLLMFGLCGVFRSRAAISRRSPANQ